MPRLPAVEKLPLAVRKNLRDKWDSDKATLEKELSDLLGESWTFEANPNAIWPYHNGGWAEESLGSCIKDYYEGAIYQLKYLTGKNADLAKELNTVASAHVLVLDVDDAEPPRFTYNGVDIVDGKLRLLFAPKELGTNGNQVLIEKNLLPAINAASEAGADPSALSFNARKGIKEDYEADVEDVRKKIADLTGKPDFKLVPGFEDTYAKLKAYSGSGLRSDWQELLGAFTFNYFKGLASTLNWVKVGSDELVQEAFNEAVEKAEARFRIVDKLKYDSGYAEVDIEDGVLYIQTTPDNWGTNIDDAAKKILDRL